MQTNSIPYYEQWLGPWAMAEGAFRSLSEMFRGMDLHVHLNAQQARGDAAGRNLTQRAGQVAVIDLTGKLMKQEASMGGGTSTVQARRDIRAAANDPDVSAILLRIDSPGGTAAGTQELANEIAAASDKKRVECYVEDMAASAAYWAASQADKITANSTALIGSIGTYGVVQDSSGMAAKEGVKVHVVRAGAHKGAGTPGTEVTAEHLADMQRIVDGLNEHFLAGVSSGRGMSMERVREIADGRAHLATQAKEMGLIDAIGSFDETLATLQAKTNQGRTTNMQATLLETAVDAALTVDIVPVASNPEPQPDPPPPAAATYQQIKSSCIGADPAFICRQLDAAATLETAQAAWMAEQNERIEAAKQPPGVDPVGTKPSKPCSAVSDAVTAFNEAVQEKVSSGMTKARAVASIVKTNPELHAAYLAAVNS